MTKEFWKAAAIRMLHTVAQVALATIGTATVLDEVNWMYVLSATAVAGLISLLKSIVLGVPEVNTKPEDDIVGES